MRIFLLLPCVLCATLLHGIFDGTCPRRDPPPGVLVLSPGSELVLTCKGHVMVDGVKVNIARDSSNNNRRWSSSSVAPTTTGNIMNDEHTTDSSPTSAGGLLRGESHWEAEEVDGEGDYEEEEEEGGEEGSRVTRGIKSRPWWKWNGKTVGTRGNEWRKLTLERRGATLCLRSARETDSGRYTCHHRGRERFSLKVIVAYPPESPRLSCYKKSPSSKIRCEWKPQRPVTGQTNCYLILNRRPLDTFLQFQCSYSSRLSRYWCALDHNEDELRKLHMAYLCVTSIAGNATSALLPFTPLNILKPDPPSNVIVAQVEGHETWMRVTWYFPTSWKPQDTYYELIYEVKYRPLESPIYHEQVARIKSQRYYKITDALPGVTYLIQLRAKEEYDGEWSAWSTPFNASSWTAQRISDDLMTTTFLESAEEGSAAEDDTPDVPGAVVGGMEVSHPALWISGSLLLLSVVLAAYMFRYKDRLMSKLHRVSVVVRSEKSKHRPNNRHPSRIDGGRRRLGETGPRSSERRAAGETATVQDQDEDRQREVSEVASRGGGVDRRLPQNTSTTRASIRPLTPKRRRTVSLSKSHPTVLALQASPLCPSLKGAAHGPGADSTGLFTMTFKGGTCALLLIVACAALAKPKYKVPEKLDLQHMVKRLMMRCQNKGYHVPMMMLQNSIFNYSGLPKEDTSDDSSNTNLSTFLDDLKLAIEGTIKDSVRVHMADSDQMTNNMWNCTTLRKMIRLMWNSSEASACYMQAVVAPLSWKTLTMQGENSINPDHYDTLLWAARPAMQDLSSSRMNLPTKVEAQYMEKMMMMLREVHYTMSLGQRARVAKWAKEQIAQKYFNCTLTPPSDSSSREESNTSVPVERCKPSLKWLNLKAMTTMGPYLSGLAPGDVDSSEKLCEFFLSGQLKSTMSRVTNMKPSLSKMFLQKIQECFNGREEFAEHVDKLGPLACYYDAPKLPPGLSKKLLSQLANCDNPRITQLKKRLVTSVMANSITAEALRELGSSVTLLSLKQLSSLSATNLKGFLQNLGPEAQWSKSQQRILVNKQLELKKCKVVSGKDLIDLQSVAEGLPSCVLKHAKAQEILDDPEALKNISKRMGRGKLKAMLHGLRNVNPPELVQKLSGPLFRTISLNRLKKANITSLDQVEDKPLTLTQAAYVAKKMQDLNRFKYRGLRSVIQGITCKMIDKIEDKKDTWDMALAITETPRWLSKVQGEDLSKLTTEDVSRLGELSCELPASQLRPMSLDVLRYSLLTMASCSRIPKGHRANLVQLVNETFGNPSDWSAETMEGVGPLLFWDNNATAALPNKPWMKDVLHFLRSRLPRVSDALKKKLFDLTTNPTASNAERRKRAADINTSGKNGVPTVELIQELESDNVDWTAAQLETMSTETFRASVDILGPIAGYNADQLAVLSKKATEAFGPVSQMTESAVMQMGCITQGFSHKDLERLPFSLDAMEDIAHCGWDESQMTPVWKGVAKYNNLTAQQLGAAEMVALNQFICGLTSVEIQQLDMEAFKDAVGSMYGVQCPYEVAQQFKSLAVSAFEDPSTWTEARVSDLGNIIAGLNAPELASLNPSVGPFLCATCIPLIPTGNFAALSVAQLEALGPDNAAVVTTEQKAVLGTDQLAALDRAETGTRLQTPKPAAITPGQSGAPSLTVEGISAFMKPVLFFLIGFLLL
ncbi:putative otoancorin [Scophthalmus maximus]|uniref:Putative otoancorin n=1 Tax=Scophthalmus maximus TaxID=52904 RepID=A0A2U9AY31_SCOMX|nr:putative otoancorin [Scophthalmus maximus]